MKEDNFLNSTLFLFAFLDDFEAARESIVYMMTEKWNVFFIQTTNGSVENEDP